MSLLSHVLTFVAGGSIGAVMAALLFAHGERERVGREGRA